MHPPDVGGRLAYWWYMLPCATDSPRLAGDAIVPTADTGNRHCLLAPARRLRLQWLQFSARRRSIEGLHGIRRQDRIQVPPRRMPVLASGPEVHVPV